MMRRGRLWLTAALALCAAPLHAQPELEVLPPAEMIGPPPSALDLPPSLLDPPTMAAEAPLAGGVLVDDMEVGPIVSLAPPSKAQPPSRFAPLFDDFPGYNPAQNRTSWLAGDEDRFGIVDLEWLPTIPRNAARGLVTGFGVHWLDGPASTDMPPRLYDFTLGYHWRERLSPTLALDLAFRVGAFSDFESSARKGVRYPSHAVVYGRLDPAWELALGVDVLDRDDISLLPVVGAIWTPGPNLRVDALFPRPRAAVRLAEDVPWIYIRGELGGGTWAIQRVDQSRDNATYRDLRLAGGLEFDLGHGASSSFEVAYVFARELTYRSGVGNYQPGDTIMLSLIGAY